MAVMLAAYYWYLGDILFEMRNGYQVVVRNFYGQLRVADEGDPRIDDDAARNSIFRGLAASGWHTAALTMRLLVESELKPAGGIVGAGFDEFRWPYPVRPGDELRVESEVIEVRPSKSRPEQGMIKVRTTTFNQDGKAVQILVSNLVVPRRQPQHAAGGDVR